MSQIVEIVSTAHWEGDPRLNRHVLYLVEGGHEASFVTFASRGRTAALRRALSTIRRSKAGVIVLPDPELYALGALVARLSGKRPIIDIHEDYGKAAMARTWVPAWARWLVRLGANLAVLVGRWAAWRVMVAAPELARRGDFLVLNIPDPNTLGYTSHDGSKRLVYVGDLTVERGALTMIELIADLPEDFTLLLIGGAGEKTSRQIRSRAGQLNVADRVELTGKLEHDEAWQAAGGSLAGLNLLQPVPAYREAVATKLWEYLAVGLPPIVSDLPGQRRAISRLDKDLVCGSVREASMMTTRMAENPSLRAALGEKGRELLESEWDTHRPDVVTQAVVVP